eukprot:1186975-Prorocentrum_minimum.AAC.2
MYCGSANGVDGCAVDFRWQISTLFSRRHWCGRTTRPPPPPPTTPPSSPISTSRWAPNQMQEVQVYFSGWTNRTHEARVYFHDGPIGHRKRGYILTAEGARPECNEPDPPVGLDTDTVKLTIKTIKLVKPACHSRIQLSNQFCSIDHNSDTRSRSRPIGGRKISITPELRTQDLAHCWPGMGYRC